VQAIKEGLEETERLQSLIETLTLEKTRISAERLIEVREKKLDWYLSAEEALKFGVIDEIMN
jgi:ATP-dependent protease ClpP protease subunit